MENKLTSASSFPASDAVRRHFRVGKPDMRDFYAIVESYEGLATVRTVDTEGNVVEMDVAPDQLEAFQRLLEALSHEMDISEVEAPRPGRQVIP